MGKRENILSWVEENDRIIQTHVLDNPDFDVRPDGTIWTRISVNGAGLIPDGSWRQITATDREDYIRVQVSLGPGSRTNRENRRRLKGHRIVYLKYCGPLDPALVINHKNGIKNDNRPENLELVTVASNNMHKYEVLQHDPIQNFVLSFEIADEIRALKKEGWTHRRLCEKFKISKGHVSQIVNNKIWVRKVA